jgi:hypothetical protein
MMTAEGEKPFLLTHHNKERLESTVKTRRSILAESFFEK